MHNVNIIMENCHQFFTHSDGLMEFGKLNNGKHDNFLYDYLITIMIIMSAKLTG